MGHKAVGTIHNLNKPFGPGLANQHTVQWWFKKFCKGVKSLEDEECCDWPSKVNNGQLRVIMEADSLKTTWEVAKELSIDHSMVIQHLKQIGKVEKLDRWEPRELTTNQKNCHFEVLSSLILHKNKEQLLDQIVTCDQKWILWQPAQWLDGKEAPKHFPKPNLHHKSHSHSLVVSCPYDPLQLSESQQNHCIWDVCSANWCDAPKTVMPAASIGQQNGSISSPWQHLTAHSTTTLQNEWIGLWSFASSIIFTWVLADQLQLLQISWQVFAGKMLPQPARGRKCFPRVCQILIFMLQE